MRHINWTRLTLMGHESWQMFELQAATARDDSDRMRKVFESKAAGVNISLENVFSLITFIFSRMMIESKESRTS